MQTREIVRLNEVHKRIIANAGVTMIEGAGSLVGAHTVEVSQPDGSKQRYTAKHILIATGGRAHRVNIPGKVSKVRCQLWQSCFLCWAMVLILVC